MNFLSGAFPIGRLFGITIRVHMLFVLLMAFRLFQAGPAFRDELLFWTMLFGIVLIHEFGHCLAARSVGGDAEDILLWPLGGLAYAHAPMRPWPQFVTVAGGPLVNVIFCIVSAALIFAGTQFNMLPGVNPLKPVPFVFGQVFEAAAWVPYVYIFYHVNLWLLAFNLLPIYPLDGGQLFHAMVWPFLGLQRATILACQVGLVGAGLLLFWAIRGEGSGILVFIALFGGITCWQRMRAARQGYVVEDPAFTPTYDYRGPRRGFWARLFKTGGGRARREAAQARQYGPVEFPNPNPGGWEAKQQAEREETAELDRILKKVSERGIQSLSYVERQTLERITPKRKDAEREYQRDNAL